MANFILIHGAWHGPWCWYKITPLLRNAGHQVTEINLNNIKLAEISLKIYVDYVENIINKQNNQIIVLGHSMAGIILSSLSNSNIKALIYLSAFVINNQAILDIVEQYPSPYLKLIFNKDFSLCTIANEYIQKLFYNKSSFEDINYAINMLKPQAYKIFTQKSYLITQNHMIKKYYIKCKYDNAVSLDAQEKMITTIKLDKIYQLDSDHSPFFSDTTNLFSILENISSMI